MAERRKRKNGETHPRRFRGRGIALLTIVGAIAGCGRFCYSSSHSPPPQRKSRIRLRAERATSASLRALPAGGPKTQRDDSPRSALEGASPTTTSSSASIVAVRARGGADDDAPPRPGLGGRDELDCDSLPPQRPLQSRDHDVERDYGRRSHPMHTGREDSVRRGSVDHRRGRGASRSAPRPYREESEGRFSRHDRSNIDGRPEWDSRDRREGYRGGQGQMERKPRSYESGNTPKPGDKKSKKWFTLKKVKPNEPSNDRGSTGDPTEGFDSRDDDLHFPSPPPPPPPPPLSGDIDPAGTERTPIHYMFPMAEASAEERNMSDHEIGDEITAGRDAESNDAPEIPFPDTEEGDFADGEAARYRQQRKDEGSDKEFQRMSPRRDAVTTFMSSRGGALQVRLGGVVVGAAFGGFIGKTLMNDPLLVSAVMSSIMFLVGFLRNDYGELSRALGLAFIISLQRTKSVRKDYPTLTHIKAMIRQGPRRPFPPVEEGSSPWKYEPIYRGDPEFTMTYALLSMALVGSFCGGNVPVLPAWIGGIAGAVAFASLTTGSNARGDLARTMGMRVVGLVRVVLDVNSDLRILGKAATVSGLIFDKVMIMDRKHRIKDRIVGIFRWVYDKASRTAENVKEEMQEERPERGRY